MLLQSKIKYSSKKQKSTVHPKVYENLRDIPVFNFERIIQHGEIEFIIVQKHLRKSKLNKIIVQDALDKMVDQYFKAFDIDLRNDEMFLLIQKLIEVRESYMKGRKDAMNFIKFYERQIADMRKNSVKPNLSENRMAVTKWFGPMDPKKTTMDDFISAVKLMQREAAIMASKNERKHG